MHLPHPSDGSWYQWTDQIDSVEIKILALETKSQDINVKLTENGIQVIISNVVVIQGSFYAPIQVKSHSWLLEDKLTFQELVIYIEKQSPSEWPILIKSGLTSALPHDLDPHSLYLMAEGITSENPMTALKLYSYAGDHKCIPALLKLAAWYELGKEEAPGVIPVARNPTVSLIYHVKAAELGSSEAAFVVMSSFVYGSNGNMKSYSKAMEWAQICLSDSFLKEFSPKLFITVHWHAGLLYMEGGFDLGDPKPEKSILHWEQSAALGHAHSLWNMGVFYLNGFGTQQDVEQGIGMICKAMDLESSLNFPPPLEGLNPQQIQQVIDLSKLKPPGTSFVDVGSLVQVVLTQLQGLDTIEMKSISDVLSTPEQSHSSIETKHEFTQENSQEETPLENQENQKMELKSKKKRKKKKVSFESSPASTHWTDNLWIYSIPILCIGMVYILRKTVK